jgi:rhodanese-related sulfurtransferase
MLKRFLSLAALSLVSLAVHAEVINIDNAELTKLMAKGVPLVDIRTEGEWKGTGVIAGSKLLTFFNEQNQANPPVFVERLKPIAKPDQPVILICRSGNRSGKAGQYLSEQAGYKTVYNVSKGIGSWSGEGRALVPAK